MNTLIFKDGKKAECLSVLGALRFVKGAERDCLTFNFNADNITPNKVMSLFSDESKISEITVCADNESNGFVYSDYTLFAGLEIKDEVTQKENNTSPQSVTSIIAITMGQINFSEKLEKEKNEQLEILLEISADMLGGAL